MNFFLSRHITTGPYCYGFNDLQRMYLTLTSHGNSIYVSIRQGPNVVDMEHKDWDQGGIFIDLWSIKPTKATDWWIYGYSAGKVVCISNKIGSFHLFTLSVYSHLDCNKGKQWAVVCWPMYIVSGSICVLNVHLKKANDLYISSSPWAMCLLLSATHPPHSQRKLHLINFGHCALTHLQALCCSYNVLEHMGNDINWLCKRCMCVFHLRS